MLAIRMIARVRDVFQVELPVRTVFKEPSIGRLAVVVTSQVEQAEREEKVRVLAELEELSDEEAEQLLANTTQDRGES